MLSSETWKNLASNNSRYAFYTISITYIVGLRASAHLASKVSCSTVSLLVTPKRLASTAFPPTAPAKLDTVHSPLNDASARLRLVVNDECCCFSTAWCCLAPRRAKVELIVRRMDRFFNIFEFVKYSIVFSNLSTNRQLT